MVGKIYGGEKKCEECMAHYTGEHTCPPWMKELNKKVGRALKKLSEK